MKLQGQVALVTGAAKRLGRAIALRLAADGADVVVHYGSSGDEAEATVSEIRAGGVESWSYSADLSHPAEIERLFAEIEARAGRLDVLVNSAASFVRQPLDQITTGDWDNVMAVNLRAPFLCSQHAAHLMRKVERPGNVPAAIINLADLSGVQAWRNYTHHSVSKAGVLHLTKTLARELAPDVRVNALVPGAILPPPGMESDSAEWHAIGKRVPLSRTGDADDVTSAVGFLVASDFVTGVAIEVDGGEHLVGPCRR